MLENVRRLHATSDHERIYAVADVQEAYVEYNEWSRRLYCHTCRRTRCEHVDMVAAHRRQQQRIMRGA